MKLRRRTRRHDETLHILTHFQTFQQTTEYTCGAACSLMVLNWFGKKRYHELLVGQLIESIPEKGSTVENIADFFDLIGWDVDYHADTELRPPEELSRLSSKDQKGRIVFCGIDAAHNEDAWNTI